MQRVTTTLLTWYRTNRRDVPWRKTHDAYRIFISELMLQQTQVDRVVPKYRSFIKTFPTWKSLANARTAELIHAWAGLGYNRRALYAREAARQVITGGVPSDEAGWRTLKGVGPYMAAALTEFVNHGRALVMDTNVRRVIGRLALGIPYPQLKDDGRILDALDSLTPRRTAHWDFPQALMDFANAVCVSSRPSCATCPLRTSCLAAKKFLSQNPPIRPKRIPAERIHRDKPFPDRIYRGRIVSWIRTQGATKLSTIGTHIDPDFDAIADNEWLNALCTRLAKDGLIIVRRGDTLALPYS